MRGVQVRPDQFLCALPQAVERVHVTPSALLGADIWFDTQMAGAVFFDRLYRALRAIKADRPIEFFPCRVLPATALH